MSTRVSFRTPLEGCSADATRPASNSPPNRPSTPRTRKRPAFGNAYSPYAAMRAEGLSDRTRSITGSAKQVAVCMGK